MFDFSKNLFPKLLSKKMPVYGMPIKGVWMDIGRPADLMRASIEMVNRRGKEDAIPGVKTTGRILALGHVSVAEGAMIEGPCFIGSDVKIGERAKVRRSCLHDGVSLGQDATVADSLIMDYTVVGKGGEVAGSVVGSGCEAMDGARLTNCVVGDGVKINAQSVLRDVTLS